MNGQNNDGLVECLDVGGGASPHSEATAVIDLREDIESIEYSGVDISTEEWPLPDNSVQRIVSSHTLEHIPRDRLHHVIKEMKRVLVPGGEADIVVPHVNTFGADRNPYDTGSGGYSLKLIDHLDSTQGTEAMVGQLRSAGRAELQWPVILRPSLRISINLERARIAYALTKIPFVDGEVVVKLKKVDQ